MSTTMASFRLDDKMLATARLAADALGLTLTDVVAQAIAQWLAAVPPAAAPAKPPRPPSRAQLAAERVTDLVLAAHLVGRRGDGLDTEIVAALRNANLMAEPRLH